MILRAGLVLALLAVALWMALPGPSSGIRFVPAGVTQLHSPIVLSEGAELRGVPGKSVLRAAADFQGRALVIAAGNNIYIRDLVLDGNRDALEVRTGLPPYDTPFARFTSANGIFAERVSHLRVTGLAFQHIAGFAVLISRARDVTVERAAVTDSGSRNAAGRNNTTGGILLEEGTQDFRVIDCTLRDIRGNGIWTHSLYTSPRNARGVFAGNRFDRIGRDAMQAGHVTAMRIERNQGTDIGFPLDNIDVEGRAIPVAIDTAGNVDASAYEGNIFREVNGKCFDLDGFHDGVVRGNVCINARSADAYPWGGYGVVMNNTNPDMQSRNVRIEQNRIEGAKFGGIFVIGTNNTVSGNQLLNLNIAHCNEDAARFGCYYAPGEPDMLRTGIYLGRGAERPAPARGNVIERNTVSGWKMDAHCVGGAPSIHRDWNIVRWNNCRQ